MEELILGEFLTILGQLCHRNSHLKLLLFYWRYDSFNNFCLQWLFEVLWGLKLLCLEHLIERIVVFAITQVVEFLDRWTRVTIEIYFSELLFKGCKLASAVFFYPKSLPHGFVQHLSLVLNLWLAALYIGKYRVRLGMRVCYYLAALEVVVGSWLLRNRHYHVWLYLRTLVVIYHFAQVLLLVRKKSAEPLRLGLVQRRFVLDV